MTFIVSTNSYVVDVQSSMIQTIAFSAETESLWVKFKPSGECYEYGNVAKRDAEGLRTASSHGTFLNSNIKSNYTDRKGTTLEFDVFCNFIKYKSILVPNLKINWNAVSAVADSLVWDRY